MNAFFNKLKAWLTQTSTKAGLATVGVATGLLVAGVTTPEVAVPIIATGAIGLVFSDKATVASVEATVEPALLSLVEKPSVAGVEAAAVKVAVAELPAVEAKLPPAVSGIVSAVAADLPKV